MARMGKREMYEDTWWGRLARSWENNIETDLRKKKGREVVVSVCLIHDRDRRLEV